MLPIAFPFLTPAKRSITDRALFGRKIRLFSHFHSIKTLSLIGRLKPSMKASNKQDHLPAVAIDRIIEMAWEDRTPFEAINFQFGLSESAIIALMRRELKPSSWRRWRARVQGRSTKHASLSAVDDSRFKSDQQRIISINKLSKR